MKKIVLVLCLVSLVICQSSAKNISQLVKEARNGKAEAYKSLAICYRDGDRLSKSWLNMICMYEIYCLKTGGEVGDIVKELNEGHPFRLLTDILYMTSFDDKAKQHLSKMRSVAPIEAQTIDVVEQLLTEDVSPEVIGEMNKLVDEGSELAAVYLGIYYQESEGADCCIDCYDKLAERYPIFYLLLGEKYIERYHDDGDFTGIQKAIDYYYMADQYGMLTPKYAYGLLSIYDYFGKQGMIDISRREEVRLKRIAKTYEQVRINR